VTLPSRNSHTFGVDLESRIPPRVGLVVLVATIFGIVALGVVYVRGMFWNEPFPLNTFFPGPATRFGDFFGSHDAWRRNQFSDVSYAGAYFPATYLFLDLLVDHLIVPYTALFVYFLSVFVGTVAGTKLLLAPMQSRSIGRGLTYLIVLINYPFLFMAHTGNLEGWTFVLILLAVGNVSAHREERAAIYLGLAIAMKAFPIVFLPLLIFNIGRQRMMRVVLRVIVTAAASTILALLILPGGLTSGWSVIRNLLESQAMYKELMVYGDPGTNFGHSMLNGIHAVFGSQVFSTRQWWWLIALIGAAISGLVFVFQHKSRVSLWKVATTAAITGCLFVPTSTDYKLLYFIPAILLFCVTKERIGKFDCVAAVLLVFIISPKPWLVLSRSPYFNAGVWLTPLLMTLLLGLLASDAFRSYLRLHSNQNDFAD